MPLFGFCYMTVKTAGLLYLQQAGSLFYFRLTPAPRWEALSFSGADQLRRHPGELSLSAFHTSPSRLSR